MALFIQIVNDQGNPDAVSSLADVVIDSVLAKGVGLFRTEAHVAKDIRDSINELIRTGYIAVRNPVLRDCPHCSKAVAIWHVFADGSFCCTDCLSEHAIQTSQ